VWLPTQDAVPTAFSTDLVITAARDLTAALQHPSPASLIYKTSDSQVAALQQLTSIFASVFNSQPTLPPVPIPTPPPGFPALARLAPAPKLPPIFPTIPMVTQAPIVAPFQSTAAAPPVPTDLLPKVLHSSPVQTDVPPVPPIVPPVLPAVTYQHRTSYAFD
jgi:hypothetical protein